MAANRPRLVFQSESASNERVRWKKKKKGRTAENQLEESKVESRTVNLGEHQSFKVVFLGDASVGKTCLVHMIIHKKVHSDATRNTIGFDHQQMEIQVDGMPMTLVFWDTAGMEQFRTPLVSQYYRHVDGVILVYDITRHETFENLEKWLSEVNQYCRDGGKKKILLIGNQCDKEVERAVSSEEGQLYAERNGMLFVELSAKEDRSMQLLEKKVELLTEQMFIVRERESMTRSMSSVIRLEGATISSDWVMVDAPSGPIPSSAYANQDRSTTGLGHIRNRMGQCQC